MINSDLSTRASETRNPNRTVERIHGLERDKARRLLKLAKRGQRDPREKLAPAWLLGHETPGLRREKRNAVELFLGQRTDELCEELRRREAESPQPGDIWSGYDPDGYGYLAWLLISKDEETGMWLGLPLRWFGSLGGYRLRPEEPCGPIALDAGPVGIWQRLQWRIGFVSRATLRDLQISHRRPTRR